MNCPACHTTLPSGAKSCPTCGLMVPATAPSSIPSPQQPASSSWQPTQPQPPPIKNINVGQAPMTPAWPPAQAGGYAIQNDSGTGATAQLPAELAGFNFGAFMLNWIWSIANRSYIGLLTFVPCVGLIFIFVLGFKGNEWAWQNRRWDSADHFRATQRIWMFWGIGLLVLNTLSIPVTAAILLPLINAARAHSQSMGS